MIEYVVVEWSEEATAFHRIDEDLDEDGEFYAILAGTKQGNGWDLTKASLLYVGLSFDQETAVRIKQDHSSYALLAQYASRNPSKDIIVVVGSFIKEAGSVSRHTSELAADVEALLISENQPKFNSQNKKSYNGRPLVVINVGSHFPLKRAAKSSASAFTRWEKEGGWDAVEEYLEG